MEARVMAHGLPASAEQLRQLKAHGLLRCAAGQAREARPRPRCASGASRSDVRPVFKRIDTCAAEFASPTAYMYSTYERGLSVGDRQAWPPCARPSPRTATRSSSWAAGPTASARASSSTTAAAMPASRCRKAGTETIMVNCNPETVSTDYDTSDRLYFEPLTAEDVLEIIARRAVERHGCRGVIVQFGGQTPLKLAHALEAGRRADPRHLARCHRPRRGPRPVQGAGRAARAQAARQRHRAQRRPRPAASPTSSAIPW